METIIFKANKKKTKVIKQLLKAMDINFTSANDQEINPEMVEKINRGIKEINDGSCQKIKLEDLWS